MCVVETENFREHMLEETDSRAVWDRESQQWS